MVVTFSPFNHLTQLVARENFIIKTVLFAIRNAGGKSSTFENVLGCCVVKGDSP
jgi:hypothetical protein